MLRQPRTERVSRPATFARVQEEWPADGHRDTAAIGTASVSLRL